MTVYSMDSSVGCVDWKYVDQSLLWRFVQEEM